MRQLLPVANDQVDLYDAYRPTPGASLRLNMVASADGSVTDERGRSGMLGGAGDREVFRTLRAHADAILVGAGTVRAEGYGPHRMRPDLQARRRADGRPDPATIVVVSRSLDLDFASPLFRDAAVPTTVLTCASASAAARAEADQAGRLVIAGQEEVDLAQGLWALRTELGAEKVLCEGGPGLNRRLLEAELVDELCLTIAPALLGGTGPRLVPDLPARVGLTLASLLTHDSELFCRYRVGQNRRSSGDSTPRRAS